MCFSRRQADDLARFFRGGRLAAHFLAMHAMRLTAALVYVAQRLLHLHPAVLGAIFLFGLGLRLLAYVRRWRLPTL